MTTTKKLIYSVFQKELETILVLEDNTRYVLYEPIRLSPGDYVTVGEDGELIFEEEKEEVEEAAAEETAAEAAEETKETDSEAETTADEIWSFFDLCEEQKQLPQEIEKIINSLKKDALKEYFKSAAFERGAAAAAAAWERALRILFPAFKKADKDIVISAVLIINEKLDDKYLSVWGRGPAAAFKFIKNRESLPLDPNKMIGAILAAAGAKEPVTEEEMLLAAARFLKEGK